MSNSSESDFPHWSGPSDSEPSRLPTAEPVEPGSDYGPIWPANYGPSMPASYGPSRLASHATVGTLDPLTTTRASITVVLKSLTTVMVKVYYTKGVLSRLQQREGMQRA